MALIPSEQSSENRDSKSGFPYHLLIKTLCMEQQEYLLKKNEIIKSIQGLPVQSVKYMLKEIETELDAFSTVSDKLSFPES